MLEAALNRFLDIDPESQNRMAALEGKIIALHIRVLELEFFLIPTNGRIDVWGECEDEPDVRISGTPLAFAAQAGDASGNGLDIEGDASLGQDFSKLLIQVDLDWEEMLSKITGDVVAHQVGRFVRNAFDWAKNTRDTLVQNTGEYLVYESRHLPPKGAVGTFMEAVDELRSDTDRLEARIERLGRAKTDSAG